MDKRMVSPRAWPESTFLDSNCPRPKPIPKKWRISKTEKNMSAVVAASELPSPGKEGRLFQEKETYIPQMG